MGKDKLKKKHFMGGAWLGIDQTRVLKETETKLRIYKFQTNIEKKREALL